MICRNKVNCSNDIKWVDKSKSTHINITIEKSNLIELLCLKS